MASARTFSLTTYMVLSVALGMFLGMFLGYEVLPSLLPREGPLPSGETLAALDEARTREESRLAASLEHLQMIEDVQVSVVRPAPGERRGAVSAVVTVTPVAPLNTQRVAQISDKAARTLDAHPRFVSVYDHEGQHLNAEAQQAAEKLHLWTGIAINIAKVLGILAALITLRFMVQSIGHHFGVETGSGCRVKRSSED